MAEYGLIGKTLSHSFSKPIHEQLGGYSYELLPMELKELDRFLTEKKFRAVNVTIPYKETVIPYCDELDEHAAAIGAVNTIVNENGRLIGHNTDFAGMMALIRAVGASVQGAHVLILGSGGTCKTASAVMQSLGAASITVASRSNKPGTVSYEQAQSLSQIQIIVNASPAGMFPNNAEENFPLSRFKQLQTVIDVVYNPIKTNLVLDAQSRGIPAIGGLLMLVAQAKYAADYFLSKTLPEEQIDAVYESLIKEKKNLVLCGMPMSGKTTIGKRLANMMNRRFVDLDDEIVKRENKSIPEIFDEAGEAGFRKIEAEVVREWAKENGCLISCGGGTVLSQANVRALLQNGEICLIDRPLSLLSAGEGRPLAKSMAEVSALYDARMPVYRACCTFSVTNDADLSAVCKEIEEKFYETACTKRAES